MNGRIGRIAPADLAKVCELAGVPAAAAKGQPEAAFVDAIIRYARERKWRCAHFRPARTATGWRTAVSGDGAGFPDLILLRPPRIVVIEAKAGRNTPTPAQLAWLHCFSECDAQAFVWWDRDGVWDEVRRVLA